MAGEDIVDIVDTVVTFTLTDPETGLSFTDAIRIPGNLTDTELKRARADVERQKQERFEAWKTAIATPAPAPDPVVVLEQLAEQRAQVQAQVEQAVAAVVADPELAARADEIPVVAAVIDEVQAAAVVDVPIEG